MKHRLPAALALAALLCGPSPAETRKANFEFIEQKYGDILYALSDWSGMPIVADDTVAGTASFQYAGTDFENAFASFLLSNRLYCDKAKSAWTVSKIRVGIDGESGVVSVDAFDVTPAQILERVSRETKRTILYDVLPAGKVSVHMQGPSAEAVSALLMKPFAGYGIESEPTHVFVRRKAEPAQGALKESRFAFDHADGVWTLEIDQARLSEIIERLCVEEKREYSNFIHTDPVLSGVRVKGKGFREALDIVIEQAGGTILEADGLFYFLPGTEKDATARIRDKAISWKAFGCRYIRQKDAMTLLQTRFPDARLIQVPDGKTLLVRSETKAAGEIETYLALIDRPAPGEVIRLKYIQTAELLKALPPNAQKDELVDTGTGTSVFFTGPADRKKAFLQELGEIDRPKSRIRYDMLIIQFDDSSDLSWGANVDVRQLEAGDRNLVSGSFGNLLSLNFDVITLFGYRFAASLNTALAENRARVCTDTTLHGISGENIKFQNTSTYRYRDSNLDPETGKPIYTGITREIISGVVMEINGWVSGDGMVTMTVNASVSKRGADVTETNGNPPPTSEKSVSTKLNTANGEPVILSGLAQNDESVTEQRIPFISRIPVLGWAFRSITKTSAKGEMVIYIVPHVSNGANAEEESRALALTAYERLVVPYLPAEEPK